MEQLRNARSNSASPLHLFAKVTLKERGSRREEAHASSGKGNQSLVTSVDPRTPISLPAEARVIADFTMPGQQPWKVDGEAFGSRPLVAGDILLGGNPTNPIARVMTYGAARRDLFWNRLKAAPGNENDSGALAATSRAGQMLSTPTVTLGGGKLHYLIQGRTRVYAAVDSHLMVEGPLHGRLVQKFDSGPKAEPRWVTHDLSPYGGHRVHVEFGPDGDGELQVLMVVEAAGQPKRQPATGSYEPTAAGRSPAEDAKEFQRAVAAANRWHGRG